MNDFELSLIYDRLDEAVESGEITEEEAREEWYYWAGDNDEDW